MAGMPERTLLADENLDAYIGTLQSIIQALTDSKGYAQSFATSCKTHGLNANKVRQYLMSLQKCQLPGIAPLSDFVVDDFDNYEFFYHAVFGESDLSLVQAMLPYDYKESVEYVLTETNLTERDVFVLRNRFGLTEDERRLTLREIASQLNVIQERVRQIEAKALRKVRHPYRQRILTKGISLYTLEEEQKQQVHQTLLEAKKRHYQEELETKLQKIHETCSEVNIALNQRGIDELELSIRSYNCLCRVQTKTIGEALDLTIPQLMKIRNLGRKSIEEIQERLNVFLQMNYDITLAEYHQMYHPDETELYFMTT